MQRGDRHRESLAEKTRQCCVACPRCQTHFRSLFHRLTAALFLSQFIRNWWILERILLPTARLDQSEMICSTGKQPSWDRKTPPIQVVSSSSIFTFLPIILSRWVLWKLCRVFFSNATFFSRSALSSFSQHSPPKSTLRHASITATSTPMAASVWTSSRTSGVPH